MNKLHSMEASAKFLKRELQGASLRESEGRGEHPEGGVEHIGEIERCQTDYDIIITKAIGGHGIKVDILNSQVANSSIVRSMLD